MNRKPAQKTILGFIAMGALTLTAIPAGATQPAGQVKEPVERHCVVTVIDNTHGLLTTGPETCFDTEEEVDTHINSGGINGSTAARSASNTIGRHYKGANYGGSSITIIGTTCNGGVWWPTGSWDNNIESSQHHCGGSSTRFYDSSSCSGTSKPIYGASPTLSWMNNKASCVRYG